MASRNTQPPAPPVPGRTVLPLAPGTSFDEVILSKDDKSFFAGLTDARIEAILESETEAGDLPFPS